MPKPILKISARRHRVRATSLLVSTALIGTAFALPRPAAAEPAAQTLVVTTDTSGITVKLPSAGAGKSVTIVENADPTVDPQAVELAEPVFTAPWASGSKGTQAKLIARSLSPEGVIESQTVISVDSQTVDPKTGQKPLQWAASEAAVGIAWWKDPAHAVTWSITRDGKRLSRTSKTNLVDRDQAARAEDHLYEITGSDPKSGMQYFYSASIPKASTDGIGTTYEKPAAKSSDTRRSAQRANPGGTATGNWRAFIPAKYVNAKLCPTKIFGKTRYFGGDNRGFSADSLDNRLRSRLEGVIQHNFKGGKYKEIIAKHTGDTTAYDKNKKLIKRTNAGTKGYTLGHGEHTSKWAERNMNIAVSDPLCGVAPKVNILFYFSSTDTGQMKVYGKHDRAPSHEVTYAWFDNARNKSYRGCAYRFNNRGLLYLASPQKSTIDVEFNARTGKRPSCKVH